MHKNSSDFVLPEAKIPLVLLGSSGPSEQAKEGVTVLAWRLAQTIKGNLD